MFTHLTAPLKYMTRAVPPLMSENNFQTVFRVNFAKRFFLFFFVISGIFQKKVKMTPLVDVEKSEKN